jgi:hypothetical protein
MIASEKSGILLAVEKRVSGSRFGALRVKGFKDWIEKSFSSPLTNGTQHKDSPFSSPSS